MFQLTLLPAKDGDCLLLAYGGDDDVPRLVLVDGGRSSTATELISHLAATSGHATGLDLAVVTHIDADHIAGVLKLLVSPSRPPIREVWFNAFHHLSVEAKKYETFSAAQGERLSDAIVALEIPWNRAFQDDAACVETEGQFREVTLDGGLRIVLLSPDRKRLGRLRNSWQLEVLRSGLDRLRGEVADRADDGFELFGGGPPDVEALAARPDAMDAAIPNGTSIAFLAEWGDRRVLLAADAHPDILAAALRSYSGGSRLKVDLFKVNHHGSAANVSLPLLELLDCDKFAFSTDGSKHGHPDAEAIAKILRHCSSGGRKTLYFNYRQPKTSVWKDADLMSRYDYRCVFPPDGHAGSILIDLP